MRGATLKNGLVNDDFNRSQIAGYSVGADGLYSGYIETLTARKTLELSSLAL